MESLQLVSDSDVERTLEYVPLIKELEKAFGKFSSQSESQKTESEAEIKQPVRSSIPVPEKNGFFASMSVHCRYNNTLAVKLLTFFPKNTETSAIHSTIVVFDPETGKPDAILDGEVVTAKRTAAASAVATKYLVNGEPSVLAILGSGVQARSHFAALSHLFKFKQVKLWNHRKSGADKLAAEIGDTATAYDSVEEAVADADVIVTATSSSVPILKACWVKKGAHINSVGACCATWAELDGDLMRSSVVYVDSKDGALKESGNLALAKASFYAEIGEVINGTKEAKRSETTVFDSLGVAFEDAVAARLVLDSLRRSS